MVVRTVEYFGFVLEREVEPLRSPFPPELAAAARAALVQALLAGETPHPDQGGIRKALERFGFYWRRSRGRPAGAAGEPPTARVAGPPGGVCSRGRFIKTRPRPAVATAS